jgi:hypothetical protein
VYTFSYRVWPAGERIQPARDAQRPGGAGVGSGPAGCRP